MRWMTLILLSLTTIASAAPTTRPTLEDLRPRYSGPVVIAATRARDLAIDTPLDHYRFAPPVPYYFWGCGYGFGICYGWGGCFYP